MEVGIKYDMTVTVAYIPIDKTVKGTGADANRVKVNFFWELSACFSKADNCKTVSFPFSWATARVEIK